MYVYNFVTLLYSRDWHNSVNQPYFKKKKRKKKEWEVLAKQTLKDSCFKWTKQVKDKL